jgi:hypothetical protein
LADPGSSPRHRSFFCPNGLGTTEQAEEAVRGESRGTVPNGAPGGRPPGRLVPGVLRQDSMGAMVPSGARGLHAPPGAGRELAWAPVVGTSEDPTAEDCTPGDRTCEGCTAQVCPPEDCTSKDNTSEDHFAEVCTADDCSSEEAGPSPDRWTVHGCSRPPATRRAGLRHGASFCHAAHSLREAADSPGILGSIHLFSDGRLGTSPDLRRELELEYPTINGKCPMISTPLDSASGRAVKGTVRKSAVFGGPGFEPEASQLFLPKWSRHYRKGRSGSQRKVEGHRP